MGNLNMIRKDDSEIKQAVQEEFKWDTRIKETEIGVEVKNGVVTLTGTVSSYAEKMAAQEAAHFVTGVLDVANDIEVKAPGSPGRTDTEIAQAVRHALEWDVGVPHERIRSTVSDGIVNLDGDAYDLGRVNDPGLHHVHVLAARRVKSIIARSLTHLVDHDAAVERRVFGDLARRRFERALENQKSCPFVPLAFFGLGLDSVYRPQQRQAASGH